MKIKPIIIGKSLCKCIGVGMCVRNSSLKSQNPIVKQRTFVSGLILTYSLIADEGFLEKIIFMEILNFNNSSILGFDSYKTYLHKKQLHLSDNKI